MTSLIAWSTRRGQIAVKSMTSASRLKSWDRLSATASARQLDVVTQRRIQRTTRRLSTSRVRTTTRRRHMSWYVHRRRTSFDRAPWLPGRQSSSSSVGRAHSRTTKRNLHARCNVTVFTTVDIHESNKLSEPEPRHSAHAIVILVSKWRYSYGQTRVSLRQRNWKKTLAEKAFGVIRFSNSMVAQCDTFMHAQSVLLIFLMTITCK